MEQILKNHLERRKFPNSPFVFQNQKGGPLHIRLIRMKLTKVFKAAKIKNFYVNDLRHNFIYRQLSKGIDPGTVSHWVGFKNLATINPFLKKEDKKPIERQPTHEL